MKPAVKLVRALTTYYACHSCADIHAVIPGVKGFVRIGTYRAPGCARFHGFGRVLNNLTRDGERL